jgi:hypothetical protein
MIKVVSLSCVDVAEGQVVFNRYLIGAHAHPLMPNGDVMNGVRCPVMRGLPPAMPGVISICWSSTFTIINLLQLACLLLGSIIAHTGGRVRTGETIQSFTTRRCNSSVRASEARSILKPSTARIKRGTSNCPTTARRRSSTGTRWWYAPSASIGS